MESQGLSENAASEAIADEVAPDNADSVARSIRRRLKGKPRNDAEPFPTGSARVGLGVIYTLLTDYLEGLDQQAVKLCHTVEQYATVSRKVEAVHKLLMQRSAELASVAANDATEQARYLLAGLEDPILAPTVIAEREAQVVKVLLEKTDHLLLAIDLWSKIGPMD